MNKHFLRYKKWGFPQHEIVLPKTLRIQKPFDSIPFDDAISLKKISFLDNGYSYSAPYSLASSVPFLTGAIYLQEAASQLPAQILSPTSADRVLDACASPGSKTTQLSHMMGNKGLLIANEKEKKRIEKLCVNLDRSGVKNAIVTQYDARDIQKLGMTFTKILVDAPCSGNFVIDQDWLEKRTRDDFVQMGKLQKEILSAAISVLESGGELVYSTCSLEIEENEEVIEHILGTNEVSLLPIDIAIGSPGLTQKTQFCRRLWPAQDKTQGFFLARLQKK
ncbi:MAG: NOL1/NOP2/sun family putative RNA methylase [Candidatus Woesearchaeota archaeon]